jgi:thiosulfate/3-mercaptopyruvate sulfurtransferase
MKTRTPTITFAFVASVILMAFATAPASAQALVSTAWLKQHLNDKNIVVLDVYVGDHRAAFEAGHIKGARYTNFSGDGWRVKINGIPGLLPPPADIAKTIGQFGIDNTSHVVVVPGGREKADFNASARVYWTLKALGHDKASILEGGDKAWFADAANPVATGPVSVEPKKFVAHFRPDYVVSRDEVKQALKAHDVKLVDARPPQQYEGKAKSPSVRVAGTIPGAVNVPAVQVAAADGTRPADIATIDKVLAKAGIKAEGKQIAFCNTGHLASGTWFMLHEIKGNKNVRLYDGSMADWTSDPALPVVAGPHS